MRNSRFQTWITELVDANLPAAVKRIPWADTGIQSDPGMGEQTGGLVFEAPDGGQVYLSIVQAGGPKGDKIDKDEEIVEGEPPAPVVPVDLPVVGGQLRMVDIEAWLAALIINAQHREVASVERYSEREVDPRKGLTNRFGFTVRWHSGAAAIGFFRYTLLRGERRSESTEFRIKEAV